MTIRSVSPLLVATLGLWSGCAGQDPTSTFTSTSTGDASTDGSDTRNDRPHPEPEASLEGTWVGDDFSCFGSTYSFEDEANLLDLDEDGEGTAFVYFVEGEDCGLAEFEVELEEQDGDQVEFWMDCDEIVSAYGDSCIGQDFTMTCDWSADELDCSGDSVWSSYDFHWDCLEGPCEG